MELKAIHRVYFLGIGGIGMSALARYFNAAGKQVAGYDKTPTVLTEELMAEGIAVHFEDDVNLIPAAIKTTKQNTLIVYTPAIPQQHSELNYFIANGFEIKKRAEVLGLITADTFTIAVAGTHGKTTTSSLIAHLLRSAGIDCSAFLGGITQNYNTNLLIAKTGNITVVEADEYDRSFLTLHPDIAIITSVDADHLDIYGDKEYMHQSYNLFADKVKPQGKLILKKGTEEAVDLQTKNCTVITYSLSSATDYRVNNLQINKEQFNYDVLNPVQTLTSAALGIPGMHNVENSVAAIAVAHAMGIDNDRIKEGLHSFKGVKRRFEYHVKTPRLVYIDDYAHHPEELKACIAAVRAIYPNKKITGIFQPHLYSRTRDFLDEFARSLEALDELILMEIYPARELPIKGITSQLLLEKVNCKNKVLCTKTDLLEKISAGKFEVLLTLGAGDIDMFVKPITEILQQKIMVP